MILKRKDDLQRERATNTKRCGGRQIGRWGRKARRKKKTQRFLLEWKRKKKGLVRDRSSVAFWSVERGREKGVTSLDEGKDGCQAHTHSVGMGWRWKECGREVEVWRKRKDERKERKGSEVEVGTKTKQRKKKKKEPLDRFPFPLCFCALMSTRSLRDNSPHPTL